MKPVTGTTAPFRISCEILAYLVEHPAAQDTIEGIIAWWLLERQIKYGTRQVQEALAALVAKRLVLERKGGDMQTHYRVNRRKLKDIRVLLKGKV